MRNLDLELLQIWYSDWTEQELKEELEAFNEQRKLFQKENEEKNRMTIQDLINKKDYDYISYRVIDLEVPEGVFAGVCHSKDGKLISNDGDSYSTNEEIIKYEEWDNPEKGIKNGLDVWIKR